MCCNLRTKDRPVFNRSEITVHLGVVRHSRCALGECFKGEEMMKNEKRLIDANALMKYINENHSYAGLPMAAHICTMELLTYAPTVDAVEVPPVKIGDTVYFIINKKIYEAVICFISWNQYRYSTNSEIRGEVQRYHTVSADFSEWNKSVFATMQQAEEALAKLTEKKTVNLEDIVDLDAQTKANNEAMRKVVSFLTGERIDNA